MYKRQGEQDGYCDGEQPAPSGRVGSEQATDDAAVAQGSKMDAARADINTVGLTNVVCQVGLAQEAVAAALSPPMPRPTCSAPSTPGANGAT